MTFSFNRDIRFAQTLPSRLYVDPTYLALEEEKIFGPTWQLVGRVADLAESGSFITAQICDEAIVIVQDRGTLRGFHNICLHRAGPVASGCGTRQTLQCRYHGWRFDGGGHLRAGPGLPVLDNVVLDAPGRRVGAPQLVDRDLGPVRRARDIDEQVAQETVDEPRLRGALVQAR